MALRKCSRCELNYILDNAPYCSVCLREMKGEKSRDTLFDVCSVCGENPALPGKDLCLFCLKEMESVEGADAEAVVAVEDTLSPEGVSEMDEIAVDAERDIPVPELGEIDRELSLDDVLAQEDAGDDDSDAQEDM